MCLEMTLRYKLFGIPGDVDEFLDKIKEIDETSNKEQKNFSETNQSTDIQSEVN